MLTKADIAAAEQAVSESPSTIPVSGTPDLPVNVPIKHVFILEFAQHEKPPIPFSVLDDRLVNAIHTEARRLYLALLAAQQVFEAIGGHDLETCGICGSDQILFADSARAEWFDDISKQIARALSQQAPDYCQVPGCHYEVKGQPPICDHHWNHVPAEVQGAYIGASKEKRPTVLAAILSFLDTRTFNPHAK